MEEQANPTVLCVDDDPMTLKWMSLLLRRRYQVLSATGGDAALELLRQKNNICVIISDLRMPRMNGAVFLNFARHLAPDAVRMMLTGHADLEAAVAAINEGQIFRFLTKPCPPNVLLSATEAAADQHRLVTAEHILLEQTLHGCIKALTDVLALTSPVSFGRAIRLKQCVSELAEKLEMPERWQVEIAAMLSQLGCIILPADTVERLYHGQPLSDDEQMMVDRMPVVTNELLSNIPRIEVVRGILAAYPKSYAKAVANQPPPGRAEALISRGAHLLRIAIDYDILEARGDSPAFALAIMRSRAEQYDAGVLQAFGAIRGGDSRPVDAREVSFSDLRVGMVLAEDVRMADDTVLLAARGYVVTAGFVERVCNFRRGATKGSLRVIVPQVENVQ
ncbi:MAG: HD domain-containing phosphohydrolase [Acidobacteriota bacterium]